jgi:hypothetical protein
MASFDLTDPDIVRKAKWSPKVRRVLAEVFGRDWTSYLKDTKPADLRPPVIRYEPGIMGGYDAVHNDPRYTDAVMAGTPIAYLSPTQLARYLKKLSEAGEALHSASSMLYGVLREYRLSITTRYPAHPSYR